MTTKYLGCPNVLHVKNKYVKKSTKKEQMEKQNEK
jgi:hypothetical protein